MQGKKTGGRVKGTPNKEKKELLDKINELFPDYHPVIAMAELANDLTADEALRFQANKEVAQYIEPKRKAIEHTGANGGAIQTDNAWTVEFINASLKDK